MKLPSIIIPVLLLSVFSTFFSRPVLALSFAPTFDVTLAANSPEANSDVTLLMSQPSGDEVADTVTVNIPAGWVLGSGANIGDGDKIGAGNVSFVYQGESQNIDFTVTNIANTEGHLARWNFEFTAPFCCLISDVDGDAKNGYSFTIDPQLAIETPINFSLTFSGSVGGVPVITNSQGGDFNWGAVFNSKLSGEVSKTKSINISSSKTPEGKGVSVSWENGAQITFSSVTSSGLTTLETLGKPPTEGTGQFQVSPDGPYYSFSSTAKFECPCEITLPYDPKIISKPSLLHLNTSSKDVIWEDVTTKIDDGNGRIIGEAKNF